MADFIKSKTFLSVLLVGLAAFVIGGMTMAWFTADADLKAAEFRAGTVEVKAVEKNNQGKTCQIKLPKGKSLKDVNPGDCATIVWEFENVGSEAVQLKVKLNELWNDDDLSVDNVYYCPVDMNPEEPKGWVMADDEKGDIWLYYIDRSTGELGSVPGTFNPENPEEPLKPKKVELRLVVVFDAEDINNDYQKATYTLGGEDENGEPSKVYAIQASNGAPESKWSEWKDVIEEDYIPDEDKSKNSWDNFEYFHYGNPGMLSKCWIKANGWSFDPGEPGEPAGPIVTFSKEHLVAASPGNKYGDPHQDTKIRGKINGAKDNKGRNFTGWVNVTFNVRDKYNRDTYGQVTRKLYFLDGETNLAHYRPPVIVTGKYTRDNHDVLVTVNGKTK